MKNPRNRLLAVALFCVALIFSFYSFVLLNHMLMHDHYLFGHYPYFSHQVLPLILTGLVTLFCIAMGIYLLFRGKQ
ncbi:MAG: hypothetical protein ACLPX5_08785 [Dissulfurispiraceae bacterium]